MIFAALCNLLGHLAANSFLFWEQILHWASMGGVPLSIYTRQDSFRSSRRLKTKNRFHHRKNALKEISFLGLDGIEQGVDSRYSNVCVCVCAYTLLHDRVKILQNAHFLTIDNPRRGEALASTALSHFLSLLKRLHHGDLLFILRLFWVLQSCLCWFY